MGDPKATSSSPPPPPPHQPPSSSSLPPGCRFYPSEEQLLSYYLRSKLSATSAAAAAAASGGGAAGSFYDAIKEINLYEYNPFDLPEFTCFRFGFRGRNRHWYCYTAAVIDGGAGRGTRRAGFGFWKPRGKVRDVTCDGGKVVLGRRKCFIFYLEKCGGAKSFTKTDWFMYEYALIDNLKASFVVCRVFIKSRNQKSISEHAVSSGAEVSAASVRHIGIQHDGSAICVLDEKEKCRDRANEMTAGEARPIIGDVQPNNLEIQSPGRAGSTKFLADSFGAEHLATFLEGDFLELDDLV